MHDDSCATLIAEMSSVDPATRLRAVDGLVSLAIEHMRAVARRMLRGFPQVQRWDETDDIVQGAALRLTRTLRGMVPTDSRHLLALMATQVRRELLDLARRYSGPESFARHHDSNSAHEPGQQVFHTEVAADPWPIDSNDMNPWTRFHEVAESLESEDKELFHLVWYLGLSQEQAARTLNCSIRTIARRWNALKRYFILKMEGQYPV